MRVDRHNFGQAVSLPVVVLSCDRFRHCVFALEKMGEYVQE